jgi:hypothetical protein
VAFLAFSVIALVWMAVFATWLYALSYGYIIPTSTPWSLGISFETAWPLTCDLVTVLFTILIVIDAAARFDQIAGRMAGGAVAVRVDEWLHGRQNQPVFMPAKKKAVARNVGPVLEAVAQPVGSVGVATAD